MNIIKCDNILMLQICLFSLVSCKKIPRTKILELEEQNKIY